MKFINSSRFNPDRLTGVRDRGIRFVLAATLFCCGTEWAQGMQYEPFRFCLGKAKVDSIRTWTWQDKGLGVPTPFKEVKTIQYQPSGCLPVKTEVVYDSGIIPDTKIYTQRPGQRAVDFTQKLENGVTVTGTEFYSASGKLDSSYHSEIMEDEEGRNFKFTRLHRYVTTPDYELVQTYFAYFNEPFRFSQGDSIVANDSGKTIYSRGDHENRVTECVDRGNTYVCTPTQVDDLHDKFKEIWFLNQGRPDSLQVYLNDGTLYYSRTYSWSSRPEATVRVRNPRGGNHRAVEVPKAYFDLRGRRLGTRKDQEIPSVRM